MTREYLVNSIRNFINTQTSRCSLTNDISEIIDELSILLGENLINLSCCTRNGSHFQLPEEFTGEFSDLSDFNSSCHTENTSCDKECCQNNRPIKRSNCKWNDFKNITCTPGFDSSDLLNGRQNNCACSFEDFDGYIYVGTGRNIPYTAIKKTIECASVPLDYTPLHPNMRAEIWRYNKNGCSPWQRVFKSSYNCSQDTDNITEISSIVSFASINLKPALYAVGSSPDGIRILKSTNGIDWFSITSNLTCSRSSGKMIVYRNRIYLSVISYDKDCHSLLYSSKDPEICGWVLETSSSCDKCRNPFGAITSMASFNNHLYIGTYSEEGFNIWRTNKEIPKVDDWKLVIDKGAGDAVNTTAVSLVRFRDNLYVGTGNMRRDLLNFIFPKGAEIIRIDKKDNWDIIAGGPAVEKTEPVRGRRNHPLSKIDNGFFNPYNIFISQMAVYNDRLFIGTFDNSTNVAPIYEFLLKNRELLNDIYHEDTIKILTLFIKLQLKLFAVIKNHFGFDLFVTNNGLNFRLIDSYGFDDSDNTGISTIFISGDNRMYLGTFNPFLGTKIYKLSVMPCHSRLEPCPHKAPSNIKNRNSQNLCIIWTK